MEVLLFNLSLIRSSLGHFLSLRNRAPQPDFTTGWFPLDCYS